MRMISRSMRGRCSFTGCAARSRWSLTRSFPCPTCPIRTLECQICNCCERTRWTSQRSKLIVWHVDGAFISFVFACTVAFWVEGNEHLSFVYYRIKRDGENNFFTSLADVCHRNRLMLGEFVVEPFTYGMLGKHVMRFLIPLCDRKLTTQIKLSLVVCQTTNSCQKLFS